MTDTPTQVIKRITDVLGAILYDARGDLDDPDKRIWPIRGKNYREGNHALDDYGAIKDTYDLVRKEEFPEITSVDEAIAAADEGFMSMKGARLMAREIEDLRALLARASRIMSGRAASQVKAEEIWRKDLHEKGLA